MPLAKTQKVDIVNQVLQSIGEPPISTLVGANSQDVNMIINTIDEVTREVQARGWSWNTDFNKTLAKDLTGIVALPANTVRVDFKRLSTGVVPVLRDNLAYNPVTQSNVFASNLVATKIVYFVEFESMPETAKRYISVKAQRLYNTRIITDQVLSQITLQDEGNAYTDLLLAEFTSNQIFEQEIIASGLTMEKFMTMGALLKIQVLEQILQNLANKRAYNETFTDDVDLTGEVGIVNEVLSLIGSRPNFTGTVDNELHQQILLRFKQVNLEEQAVGYAWNVKDVEVTADVDGKLILDGNIVSAKKLVALSNSDKRLTCKVSFNGTSFQTELFDNANDTTDFGAGVAYKLRVTYLVPIDEVPIAFKKFIATRVASNFTNQASKNGIDPRILLSEAREAEGKFKAWVISQQQFNGLRQNKYWLSMSRNRKFTGGL